MPEFSNYVEGLDAAPDATGTVLIPASRNGDPVSLTPAQIAALATGGVSSVNGETGAVTGFAKLASPTFTGTPAGPTAAQGTNTTQFATTAFVQAEVATKADILETVRTVTGSHTLDSTDLANINAGDDYVIECNSASAMNIEIPLNATVAFPTGGGLRVRNINTGIVTITAVGGVTLTSPLSAFNLSNQYDEAMARKRATNTWVANGQLSL